jgi:hypothetical protein
LCVSSRTAMPILHSGHKRILIRFQGGKTRRARVKTLIVE